MKYRAWKSARCDEVIGFLVAFEKKANTLEACCEQHIEIIDSNDSTSFSIHPAYVRHEDTARRTYRGRSRIPAQNINIKDKAESQINPEWIALHGQQNDKLPCNLPTRSSDESGLTVLPLDEAVEVIVNTKKDENRVSMITRDSTHTADSKENFKNPRKQSRIYDGSVSLQSIPIYMEEAGWKVNNVHQKEKAEGEISSNLVIPFRNSHKLNEQIPGRTNIDQSGQSEDENTNVQNSNQENKDTVVAFRDPISEVIPIEQDLMPSEMTTLVIGDLVDIKNGRYTNKIGRVIKLSDDLVLVAIVGEFVKPLYFSQCMLRRTNVSQIQIIY